MMDVTTSDSGSFDDDSFEDRTTAEQVGLDDEEGSPRPPTGCPACGSRCRWSYASSWSALLLVAVGAIWALSRQSLASSSNLAGGTVVELIPTDGSNILQQDQIGIVLKSGYRTRLTVNGTAIPVGQLQAVNYASQTQYTFQPGAGKAFTRVAGRQELRGRQLLARPGRTGPRRQPGLVLHRRVIGAVRQRSAQPSSNRSS